MVGTQRSTVYALDPASGELIRAFDAEGDQPLAGASGSFDPELLMIDGVRQ